MIVDAQESVPAVVTEDAASEETEFLVTAEEQSAEAASEAEDAALGPFVAPSEAGATQASGATLPLPQESVQEPMGTVEEEPSSPSMTLCINELQWMGTDVSTADEWLEIAAIGSGATRLSLEGWSIVSVQNGTEETMITFTAGHDIAAGEFRIVSNYAAQVSRLSVESMLVTTSVSLPNTQLLLRLYDDLGVLIDEVDDGSSAPFAGANPSGGSKASMERMDCLQPGTSKANWGTATVALGLDEGSPVLGTPGYANSVTESEEEEEDPGDSSGSTIQMEPFYKPIISEILPDPPGLDTAEWIEIENSGSGTLLLDGWSLARGTSVFRFPPGTGSLLGSGQTLQLPASITKLTLPNAGGTVELLYHAQIVDRLTYPALPEGISFGRILGEEEPRSLCVPTPGRLNTLLLPTFAIEGVTPSATVSTINLSLTALSGSMAGAMCSWNFGDGYLYDKCNPPSHAMRSIGHTTINVSIQDYCGNTVIQSVTITVDAKNKKNEEEKAAPSCTPRFFSGVTVTEFLPDPVGDEAAGEWIELHNVSDQLVDLCGWSVDDAQGGSKPFRLQDRSLFPGEYVLLPRSESKITLNNGKDSVRLIAPLPNGGTGVLLDVSFESAMEGESYALREDGEWLWTPRPTPGALNQFRAGDPWPGATAVVISAALPDPKGKDEGLEWVELRNVTDSSQWLFGNWELRTQDGRSVSVHGTGFRPRNTVRIPLDSTMITLRNTDGAIRLIDPNGNTRSVLAWANTKAGHAVKREELTLVSLDHASYMGSGVFRGRRNGERPAHAWTMRDLLLPENDGVYTSIIYEREILIKSLMENKKIELEMSADGMEIERIYLDGTELYPLLLRMGLAHVPGRETLSQRREYVVYEAEARKEKRGIWRNAETTLHIDALQERERVRDIVEREGVRLTVGPESGLVEQGAVLEIVTNTPARIEREILPGLWMTYIGGAVTRDGPMRFRAVFHDGDLLASSSVLERAYVLKRDHYPHCITVSEIYPSPQKDEGEWVELYNHCDQTIPLAGWLIDDEEGKGSRPIFLEMDQVIPAQSYHLLTGSVLGKIAFNNSGDSVVLRSPDGRIAATIAFPSIKKGWSYALVGDQHCVTQRPTPGETNVCFIAPKPAAKRKASAAKKVIIGLATKYVVDVRSVPDAPSSQSDLRAQLSGQLAGNDGILLSTVPNAVPWQLLLSVILCTVVAGVWWGWRRKTD